MGASHTVPTCRSFRTTLNRGGRYENRDNAARGAVLGGRITLRIPAGTCAARFPPGSSAATLRDPWDVSSAATRSGRSKRSQSPGQWAAAALHQRGRSAAVREAAVLIRSVASIGSLRLLPMSGRRRRTAERARLRRRATDDHPTPGSGKVEGCGHWRGKPHATRGPQQAAADSRATRPISGDRSGRSSRTACPSGG